MTAHTCVLKSVIGRVLEQEAKEEVADARSARPNKQELPADLKPDQEPQHRTPAKEGVPLPPPLISLPEQLSMRRLAGRRPPPPGMEGSASPTSPARPPAKRRLKC